MSAMLEEIKSGIKQVIEKEIRLIDFAEDCLIEIERLERLASYQLPVKVKIEQYSATRCPKCKYELSQHITDGYYRVNKVKFCPDCGQLLKWE